MEDVAPTVPLQQAFLMERAPHASVTDQAAGISQTQSFPGDPSTGAVAETRVVFGKACLFLHLHFSTGSQLLRNPAVFLKKKSETGSRLWHHFLSETFPHNRLAHQREPATTEKLVFHRVFDMMKSWKC